MCPEDAPRGDFRGRPRGRPHALPAHLGVSSVVALSPYVNKTITGDCLPILDMETGNIGAYVVLVDQTGNMATRLRAAVPGWSRRTLLPETAGNHVMPPSTRRPPRRSGTASG